MFRKKSVKPQGAFEPPNFLARLRRPGSHEVELLRLLGEAAYFRGDAPVFDQPLHLLAFVNRSGSNLLGEFLRMTTVFSGFREELNHVQVARVCRERGIGAFPDYIRHLSEPAHEQGRIYGFKASWSQIMMLYRLGIARMYPEVRVIHMQREDVLGQAISYHIAERTQRWSTRLEGRSEGVCEFDAVSISALLNTVLQANQRIVQACAVLGLPRRSVFYEDVVTDPTVPMGDIGRFVGRDLSDWTPETPSIGKQASELNAAFRRRYLEETRAAVFRD